MTGRGPRARETARTPTARVLQRRALVDELVQHPDVFRENLTLTLLDQAARGVADMLERAEQVNAS